MLGREPYYIHEIRSYPLADKPFQRCSDKELAKMQSQGKLLTPYEQARVAVYASNQRKKHKH